MKKWLLSAFGLFFSGNIYAAVVSVDLPSTDPGSGQPSTEALAIKGDGDQVGSEEWNRAVGVLRGVWNDAGKIGIGISSPTRGLHVSGSGKFESTTTPEAFLEFTGTAGTTAYIGTSQVGGLANSITEGDTVLRAVGGSIHLTARSGPTLTITPGPNDYVGIGTTTPTAKLDVAGDIKSNGQLVCLADGTNCPAGGGTGGGGSSSGGSGTSGSSGGSSSGTNALACFDVLDPEYGGMTEGVSSPSSSTLLIDLKGKTGSQVCQEAQSGSTCVAVGDHIGDQSNNNTCDNLIGWGDQDGIDDDDYVRCCTVGGGTGSGSGSGPSSSSSGGGSTSSAGDELVFQRVRSGWGTINAGTTYTASCPSGFKGASCMVHYYDNNGGTTYHGVGAGGWSSDRTSCSWTPTDQGMTQGEVVAECYTGNVVAGSGSGSGTGGGSSIPSTFDTDVFTDVTSGPGQAHRYTCPDEKKVVSCNTLLVPSGTANCGTTIEDNGTTCVYGGCGTPSGSGLSYFTRVVCGGGSVSSSGSGSSASSGGSYSLWSEADNKVGVYYDGGVGVNYVPGNSYALFVNSPKAGLNSNGNDYQRGIYAGVHPDSSTWSGTNHYATGIVSSVLTQKNLMQNNKSLTRLTGVTVQYGSYRNNTSNHTIEQARGIHIAPYQEAGSGNVTINTMYDIYSNPSRSGNTANIGKHYGIYIAHSGENYFGGSLTSRGRVRGGTSDGTEYTEIGHGGGNGYINTTGDGNLDFRHHGSNMMRLSDRGVLELTGAGAHWTNTGWRVGLASKNRQGGSFAIVGGRDNKGYLGIGMTSDGNSASNAGWYFIRSAGDIGSQQSREYPVIFKGGAPHKSLVITEGGTLQHRGLQNISSREYKKDIERLSREDYRSLLDALKDIDLVRFHYKEDDSASPANIGMIAEEVPELYASEDRKSVNTTKIISSLIGAIQIQQEEIELLKEKMQSFEIN